MLVIFDCDGTLVDSQANIIRAMEDSFAQAKLPLPDHRAIRNVVGLSLIETMQTLLPDAPHDLHVAVAQDYKQAFHRLRASGELAHEPLFPGIATLLHKLFEAGISLAVATGKSDRGLALCLDHHGLRDYFISLQTADRHPSKPHPSMIAQCLADAGKSSDACWMIGDTVYDIKMAVNAGVKSIGVDWGYHDVADLHIAGATHVVSDVAQIQSILEQQA
jgi:phosphoglycolate phosphatase